MEENMSNSSWVPVNKYIGQMWRTFFFFFLGCVAFVFFKLSSSISENLTVYFAVWKFACYWIAILDINCVASIISSTLTRVLQRCHSFSSHHTATDRSDNIWMNICLSSAVATGVGAHNSVASVTCSGHLLSCFLANRPRFSLLV